MENIASKETKKTITEGLLANMELMLKEKAKEIAASSDLRAIANMYREVADLIDNAINDHSKIMADDNLPDDTVQNNQPKE